MILSNLLLMLYKEVIQKFHRGLFLNNIYGILIFFNLFMISELLIFNVYNKALNSKLSNSERKKNVLEHFTLYFIWNKIIFAIIRDGVITYLSKFYMFIYFLKE